jgi:hypothetical protein
MGLSNITNKCSLKSFRLKFRQTHSFYQIETLTNENPKVGNVGIVACEDFIRSIVQALAEVERAR